MKGVIKVDGTQPAIFAIWTEDMFYHRTNDLFQGSLCERVSDLVSVSVN